MCGVIVPVFASTIPRSMSSFWIPRRSTPTLSPATLSSSVFWNISRPVTVTSRVSPRPTISTTSPTFTVPRSTRPVATVPRPVIENTSSIAIRNVFSVSRSGVGMYESTASINAKILSTHLLSPDAIAGVSVNASKARSAEPATTGISSPGNS